MACASGIPILLSPLTRYSTLLAALLSLIPSGRPSSQEHTPRIGSHSNMQTRMTYCRRFMITSCISTMLRAFARTWTILVASSLLPNFKHGSHVGRACVQTLFSYFLLKFLTHVQLSKAWINWLTANKYPPRYTALCQPAATSDDELDPNDSTKKIYRILKRPEHSTEA